MTGLYTRTSTQRLKEASKAVNVLFLGPFQKVLQVHVEEVKTFLLNLLM